MPMDRNSLLNAIVDDGIEEVRHTYLRPDQHDRLEGSIAGFEACRGLDDESLLTLRDQARIDTHEAMAAESRDYWRVRHRELQIEWTINVLSAAMHAHGLPPLAPPTMRGLLKASEILA